MLSALLIVGVLAQAPASPPEPSKGWIHAALIAHAVTQVLDVATTEYALGAGTGTEANPVMRPFARSPLAMGAAKAAYAVGSTELLMHLHRRHPVFATWCAVGSAVATGVIVARNTRAVR